MKGTVRQKIDTKVDGTKVKRSTWSWSFRLPNTPDGKARFSTGTARTKKEAEAALADALAEHGRGERIDRKSMTLAQFIDGEYFTLADELKATTAKRYRSLAKRVTDHSIGAQRLQAVTPADVKRFLTDMRSAKSARGKGTAVISSTTIQHIARFLSSVYKVAAVHGYVSRNPAAEVKAPARAKSSNGRVTWVPADIRAFFVSAAEDRWLPLWMMLATTGMRRGEALGLEWSALDLDAGKLVIRQALLQSGISTPKTDAGWRTIDLEPEVVAALRAWRRQQAEERLLIGPAWAGGDAVWTNIDSSVLKADSAAWWWGVAVKRSELPVIRMHDLRHSWASNALQAGVNVVLVSKRLGHANPNVTLAIYAHAIPSEAKAEASRVNGALFGR